MSTATRELRVSKYQQVVWAITESVQDARRHMVSHIRVIRLRCKLCNAGSFFLTDLRVHLQEKGCPNLNRATFPIKEAFPCMTRLQADSLCEIVDTTAPGRVRYSSEKVERVPLFLYYFNIFRLYR